MITRKREGERKRERERERERNRESDRERQTKSDVLLAVCSWPLMSN